MRLILVGQAPSRLGDPSKPLAADPVATRLALMMGLTKTTYLKRTTRFNLFYAWPGKSGKGDAWNPSEAREAANLLIPALEDARVLFLGRNVADAFRDHCSLSEYFEWTDFVGGRAAILPHPSGINLWYNDEGHRIVASKFMRRFARGVE